MTETATGYRTHTCGELRAEHAAARKPQATLAGFVDRRVDDATFVLRDHYGKTQVRVAPDALPFVADRTKKLGLEDVIQVSGSVAKREKADAALETGAVELLAA